MVVSAAAGADGTDRAVAEAITTEAITAEVMTAEVTQAGAAPTSRVPGDEAAGRAGRDRAPGSPGQLSEGCWMERYLSKSSRPWRGDRGSASVWVLAVGLAVIAVAQALVVIGSVTVARHRAQAAADLAALAAALKVLDGESAACARAAEMSARNGASLVACHLDGFDVVVTVEVVATGAPLWGAARRSARAGPVE
jgi:helicase/secretion neighborhood TadE-like protein